MRRGVQEDTHISTRITQVVLRTAVRILTGLLAAARGIGKLVILLLSPLKWLGRVVFVVLLRPTYRVYRKVRSRTDQILAPAKSRWTYLILHRHAVTFGVTLVAAFVAINNVYAQHPDPATFGQQSPFAKLYSAALNEETEVVEGPAAPTTSTEQKLALTPAAVQQARPVADAPTTAPSETQLTLGTGGAGSTDEGSEEIRYYIVEGGDTLSTIAQKFGISTNTVLWANDLNEDSVIKPGQKLTILPITGVAYTVGKNDTVESIAKKFKADTSKILSFNRLPSADALNAGDQIIVPDGSVAPTPTPSKPSTSSNSSSRRVAIFNIPPPARVTAGSRLQWPAPSHRINQYFHYGHTGIDVDGDVGQPIYAADSGVVSQVTYQRYGYGFHVIINHGGGVSTLYAHQSRIVVKPGQSVKKGQVIGFIGLTGRTTGAHLHFEVMVNGAKRNPLSYL